MPLTDDSAEGEAEVSGFRKSIANRSGEESSKMLGIVDSIACWMTDPVHEDLDEKVAEEGCKSSHECCMSSGRWCDGGAAVCTAHGIGSSSKARGRISLQRARERMKVLRKQMKEALGQQKDQEKQ